MKVSISKEEEKDNFDGQVLSKAKDDPMINVLHDKDSKIKDFKIRYLAKGIYIYNCHSCSSSTLLNL